MRFLAALMLGCAVAAPCATLAADAPVALGADPANAERIAVLLTDWAEAEGFDPLYRREVVKRSFGPPHQGPNDS